MTEEESKILNHAEALQKMRSNPIANQVTEDFFSSSSGDRLFFRQWAPTTPRSIVIAIHGLAAHGEYYVQVADQLISSDVMLYALDLKHHGQSTGKKGDLENFTEVIEQIHEFVLFLKSEHENIPIFLMGLSLGGCISVNYSVKFPNEITGLILMAPAVKSKLKLSFKDIIRFPYYILVYLINKGKPIIDITRRQRVGSRNPFRLRYDETDELRQKRISLRYLLQTRSWIKKAFNTAPNIIHPTLIVQGTEDNLVSREGVKEFFEYLTIPDKTLIELNQAYHCLFSDPAMQEQDGWGKLRAWIRSHESPKG